MPSRIEPLEQDINLLIRQDLSPQAQSAILAEFARETLAEAEATNEAALGSPVEHETIVDGRPGGNEDSVRPNGVIVYDFVGLTAGMFAWISEQLDRHSPVGGGKDPHPGLYEHSHVFFADDVEADPLKPPPDVLVGTFVSAVPYARKIEAGESPQFPDGVYEVVAHLAAQRFGKIAKIVFDYRTASGGGVLHGLAGNKSAGRNPAIIVTVR